MPPSLSATVFRTKLIPVVKSQHQLTPTLSHLGHIMVFRLSAEGHFKKVHAHAAHSLQFARWGEPEVYVGSAGLGEELAYPQARDAHRGGAVKRAVGLEPQYGGQPRFGGAYPRLVAAAGADFHNLFAVHYGDVVCGPGIGGVGAYSGKQHRPSDESAGHDDSECG